MAQRQSWLAERIVRSVNKVLAGGQDAVMAADAFGRDAALFGRVLQGMVEGDIAMNITPVTNEDALYSLAGISEMFSFVSGSVDEILATSPEIFTVRESADNIFSNSRTLLQQTSGLTDEIQQNTSQRNLYQYIGYACAAAALILLIILGRKSILETRKQQEDSQAREQESRMTNEQNQVAIHQRAEPGGDSATAG